MVFIIFLGIDFVIFWLVDMVVMAWLVVRV